jgi:hypothetical protein
MATSISTGCPLWVDDVDMTSQLPFRQYDIGSRVYQAGTSAACQVPGGVFPGLGDMQVTAAAGMAVSVEAGLCCVPSSVSALQGGYVFGLVNSATLDVAQSDPSSPRTDLVVARVYDNGDDTSFSDVEVFTGTPGAGAPSLPANSLLLATLTIPATITSVSAGTVTDGRTWVVAPGGILPIANQAAAPAAPASQLMFDMSLGQLVHGTGTAGSTAFITGLAWTPQISYVTSNVTAGSGGALVTIASVSVTTNGSTDIEIFTKWTAMQSVFSSGNVIPVNLLTYIDGVLADTVTVYDQSYSSGSFNLGPGGSARYFTSAAAGNTPSAATHTVTWKFQATGAHTSTSDALIASSSGPAILRVAPVVA